MTVSVNFVPDTAAEHAPEVAPLVELLQALRQVRIELGEDVIIVGVGARATAAEQLARVAGAAAVRRIGPSGLADAEARSADVVVLASDDAQLLGGALRLARNLGRVLLLDPLGPIDFDVYPDLHKRSIRMVSAPSPAAADETTVAFARHLLESGQVARHGPA